MNKLILHKINHKPLLIEKIFPYTINRPLIFQILLKSDLCLKESLKIAFKFLKKNNKLGDETNETFNRFISYRLIFEKKNLYEEYLINLDCIIKFIENGKFLNLYFFQNYFHEVIGYYNMDKKYKIIIYEKARYYLALDYFQYHKKFCLYIFHDIKANFEFLKKLNYLEFDIDLVFFINDKFLDIDDKIKSELLKLNFKVKNIYFVFVRGKYSGNEIIFQQIKEYIDIINKMKIKNDIKKLSIKYLREKEDLIINYLFENNLCINLENLEKVEYTEYKYLTIYEIFVLRYKLSSIFNSKAFFNLITITPEDFNNIKEKNEDEKKYLISKLNFFEQNNNDNNTDLKIILFDFQNNSPYQENFIYFCEKYLYGINSISTVVIRNIGKTNFKIDCKNNIKKPLIHFNTLKKIIVENKIIINNGEVENEMKEIIDLFFNTDNLLYKINTQNFLIYSDELKIFDIFNKDNITFSSVKIYFENIIYEIYYKKELTIKKYKDIDNNINIFNIIKSLKNLKKDFNMNLKGDLDMINQINLHNFNSIILKDKIQIDLVMKELGTLTTIFKIKKIYEGNPYLAKFRKKLFNKENVYKLAIFKTVENDIFGLCFKLNFEKNVSNSNYSFIFTSNTNILTNVYDDDIFVKDGPFFIKEYITDNELMMIKDYVIAKKKFVNDIFDYSELYFLKKFL